MPAARYWRVIGLAPRVRGDLELSEFQLHGSSGRLDAPGMLTCSHAPMAGALAALSDGAAASDCRFAATAVRSGGFWLQWDMGTAQDITGFVLGGGSAQALYLDTFTVQYSSDAKAWATLDTIGRCKWPGVHTLSETVKLGDVWVNSNQLLLHYDSGFGDASPKGTAVTNTGCTIGAAAKFGAGAAVFAGGASNYLSMPGSALVTTGDFTFETWLWLDVLHDGCVYSNFSSNAAIESLVYVSSAGGVGWYYSGGNSVWSANGALQAARWHHLRCVKVQGSPASFLLFVDGALVASTTATQATLGTASYPFLLGHAGWTSTRMLRGLLDETVVTFGARSTAAFTPPIAAYGGPTGGIEARPVAASSAMRAGCAASSVVPAFSMRVSTARLARDTEFGGSGRVWGVNEVEIAPDTRVPTGGRVLLLRQRDKLVARQTWADPVTGAWEFTGLDTRQDFLALAEDLAGNYRPVAASRLTPEVS